MRGVLLGVLIIAASAAITGCITKNDVNGEKMDILVDDGRITEKKSISVDASDRFEITCGVCHGSAGVGGTGIAPALANNEFIIKSSKKEIAATIKNGRSYGEKRYLEFGSIMPASGYSDEDINALVDYLKSLQ